MSQLVVGDAEYAGTRKTTRREMFLDVMEHVVPWRWLLALIEPMYPEAGRGRQPYPLETALRVRLMQNWFGLSDQAIDEALYEITPMCGLARLSLKRNVVAEGVETKEQSRPLRLRHCDEMQEALFSRSISFADFEAWFLDVSPRE